MNGLLEVATTLYGDGQWTIGYEVDALACGRVVEGADLCDPVTPDSDDIGTSAGGYKINPFAVIGYQKFGTRCEPDDAEEALTRSIIDASEYVIGKNFWSGDVNNWDNSSGMFLTDAAIATEAAGANINETIAKVLKKGFDNHPELDPVLHLGLGAALSVSDFDNLERVGIDKVVVNPGYPIGAVAVTGPILIRLGSVETLTSLNTQVRNNRTYISGSRIVAFEFDPCLAVRVA